LYRKTILENGLRVLTEKVPYVKSVSVGIWVTCGSRDETEAEAGLSHFIEHMIFKGTARRNAHQIAREIDQTGGMANAYTSKEFTCFHARVKSDHLPLAVDLLTDIFLHSIFDAEDIDRERQVILQEINMIEDTPDEHIYVLFGQNLWPKAALGRPILGTVETVSRARREDLFQYLNKHYLPDRIVVAAAGDVDHQAFVDLVGPSLDAMPARENKRSYRKPEVATGLKVTQKKLEQVHFCLGTPFTSSLDDRRYAGAVLNTILGGNMSSRLYQEIREKRGLAYVIFSFLVTYMDTGLLGVYAGVSREDTAEAVRLTLVELSRLRDGGIKEADINAAKEYLKGGIALDLESTDNIMTRLVKNETTYQRYISFEEVMSAIDRVTKDQVVALAEDYFRQENLALTVLGDLPENGLDPGILTL